MFIAHLPAGYLGTRALLKFFKEIPSKSLIATGLVGSVFPDLDLAYFYTLDRRQHLHHSYWPHIPAYWLAIFGIGLLVCLLLRRFTLIPYLITFCVNIFLHLSLDTVVGQVKWLYPFSNRYVYFFEVPAKLGPSMWNFIFHWSFLMELAFLSWAVWFLWKEKTADR